MNLSDYPKSVYSISPQTAKNLSDTTKSVPMMEAITPRWLLAMLPWVPVEAGVYRLNRIRKCDAPQHESTVNIVNNTQYDNYANLDNRGKNIGSAITRIREKLPELHTEHLGEHDIPQSFPDYEDAPRQYVLSMVQTILKINAQVTDIFNKPINQLKEQMRLTIEAMKEKQEWEIVNNKEFGLVHSVAPSMRMSVRKGSPTPDDLDELLARVWKKPAFFLAHPKAIAAFGRECTMRGVPPVAVTLYGSPFITWRGVPLIPCDKMLIDGLSLSGSQSHLGTTNILLMRVGEKDQGVVGLNQPGIPGEIGIPSLSVWFGGMDRMGMASYIMTLYFSIAVLTDDALGMLENVEVDRYHEYE